jgi:hypothetical protein
MPLAAVLPSPLRTSRPRFRVARYLVEQMESRWIVRLSAVERCEMISARVSRSNTPAGAPGERVSTGMAEAPLPPVDERPLTSLELLRQLEGFVREHFEINAHR